MKYQESIFNIKRLITQGKDEYGEIFEYSFVIINEKEDELHIYSTFDIKEKDFYFTFPFKSEIHCNGFVNIFRKINYKSKRVLKKEKFLERANRTFTEYTCRGEIINKEKNKNKEDCYYFILDCGFKINFSAEKNVSNQLNIGDYIEVSELDLWIYDLEKLENGKKI